MTIALLTLTTLALPPASLPPTPPDLTAPPHAPTALHHTALVPPHTALVPSHAAFAPPHAAFVAPHAATALPHALTVLRRAEPHALAFAPLHAPHTSPDPTSLHPTSSDPTSSDPTSPGPAAATVSITGSADAPSASGSAAVPVTGSADAGSADAVSAAAVSAAAMSADAGSAGWPLEPRPEVVRGFELPAKPWLPGHRGVDLAGRPGQPVLAATSGTITYAGTLAGRGVITITTGTRRTTYEPVVPEVSVGTTVHTGTVIGRLSAAGSHCPPRTCLHWGLLQGKQYLNPLSLLPNRPVRLLPLTNQQPPQPSSLVVGMVIRRE